MAQLPIPTGTTGDDGTGINWRTAWQNTDSNFTELYDFKDSVSLNFISKESDFEVQDATTITLEAQKVYVITGAITTAKSFIVEPSSGITAFNSDGPLLTYTGVGTMFTGLDASFTIRDMAIAFPNGQGFSFTDTVGGRFLVSINKIIVYAGQKYGTFDNLSTFIQEGCFTISATDGITFSGNSWDAITINKVQISSASASFVGADFGSSLTTFVRISAFFVIAPAGAIGISGLPNSGNIPPGLFGSVIGSSFLGGVTALQNITVDDIRWQFVGNTGIPNTMPDGLMSLNGNGTATVISSSNTPTLVSGTWTDQRKSQFGFTAAGRFTYLGERALTTPIDVIATIDPPSGDSTIAVYIALNGTAISDSGIASYIKSGDPGSLSTMWQLSLSQNDYIEVFVENQSGSDNITVTDAIFRVR
tara:strand:+ start:116 stop:1372 length:1257 start_codon:yes stop_codon:yes gene_type:complete